MRFLENKTFLRKILPSLLAVVSIIVLELLESYFAFGLFFGTDYFHGIFPGVKNALTEMIVALMAGIHGPLAGFMVGFLGKFYFIFRIVEIVLFDPRLGLSVPYIHEILKYALYGLVVGIFWGRYKFFTEKITVKRIVLFCIIQMASRILLIDIGGEVLNGRLFSRDLSLPMLLLMHYLPLLVAARVVYAIPYALFLIIYVKIKNKVRPGAA